MNMLIKMVNNDHDDGGMIFDDHGDGNNDGYDDQIVNCDK